MRIGMGYDVHRLVEGRPLIIGGVRVPFEKGLMGHSDADVLLHAVADSLLGAAGLGDIGTHFPDTDPAHKNADSRQLLARCAEMVRENGYEVGNVDATLLAQAPKIAPYRDAMRDRIAAALAVAPERVNVKATTTERLGFIGAETGMAAMCVTLLEEKAMS
jgi:2-C-methyl-D-erythritol 2,4-cyclodiphosphate synthase